MIFLGNLNWGSYMYKISVIIPVFNAEKTLSGAFNSILNQTFEDFELILVDKFIH